MKKLHSIKKRLSSKATKFDRMQHELTQRKIEFSIERIRDLSMLCFQGIAYAFDKDGALAFAESMPVEACRIRVRAEGKIGE